MSASRESSIDKTYEGVVSAAADEEEDEEDEDEDEESGSGQEMGAIEIIGPNTSGIRGVSMDEQAPHGHKDGNFGLREDDEDSDAFPAPLRGRKAREPVTAGSKRKR